MQFIAQNIGSFTVGAVVLVLVGASLVKVIGDKRRGKASCGCRCSGCPNAAACRGAEKGSVALHQD